MKRVFKSLYRAFAVALTTTTLFAVGCNTDRTDPTPQPKPDPEPAVVTLSASVEKTRTMMNEKGEVLWITNDAIRIFGTEAAVDFPLVDGQNTTVGYFRGTLPESESTLYSAGYPASMWIDTNTLETLSEQKYKDGSFANNTNPMISTFEKESTEISFKNLFGILKFQLIGAGTIDHIVISNNDVQMAGIFTVDPTTFALTSVEGVTDLSLVDIDVTLGSEPESFYVLVPPATYSNLTITVNCTDGTSIERVAQQDIVINRNEVLPLAAIDISATPKEYLVDAVINEEISGWNRAVFDIEYAEECAEAYIGWAVTSDYEAIVAENPDWSVVDIFNNWITSKPLDGSENFHIRVTPNLEYTYLFLGFDAEGNYESRTVTHTSKAELSDAIGVEINVENITHSHMDFTFNLTGEVSTLYYYMFDGMLDDFFANPEEVYAHLYHIDGIPVTGGQMSDSADNLSELSYYTIVVVAEGADGGLAYAVKSVQTTEYQISDATVEVNITEGDIYADIELSGNWASYKYLVIRNADIGERYYNFETIANDIHMVLGSEMQTDANFTITHLNAESRHTIVILPYDENGVYGTHQIIDINTSYPIYRPESEAYYSYLGEWSISFTDLDGNYFPESRTILIEPDVIGTSYYIRGLSGYMFDDDSIRAYFIDNEFYILAGERVANSGYEQYPYVTISLISDGNLIKRDGYLKGLLNENTLTFASSVSSTDALLIDAYDTDKNYAGYFFLMKANSWRKIVPTNKGGNTEDFILGDSVDAGWE